MIFLVRFYLCSVSKPTFQYTMLLLCAGGQSRVLMTLSDYGYPCGLFLTRVKLWSYSLPSSILHIHMEDSLQSLRKSRGVQLNECKILTDIFQPGTLQYTIANISVLHSRQVDPNPNQALSIKMFRILIKVFQTKGKSAYASFQVFCSFSTF